MTANKKLQPRRYAISTEDDGRVTLTLLRDSPLGIAGETRTYWCQAGGGYVFLETGHRVGTLGHQIWDSRGPEGTMLHASTRACLAKEIRRQTEAAFARYDRQGY